MENKCHDNYDIINDADHFKVVNIPNLEWTQIFLLSFRKNKVLTKI